MRRRPISALAFVLALALAATAAAEREHTVRPGQSLNRIARRYNVDVRELARANDLRVTANLRPGQVLRIPEQEFDVEEPLTSLGMDSLMGLELRNRIEVELGLTVAPTLLWTYPTVAALSEHLAGELHPTEPNQAGDPDEPSTAPLDDLSELSDEDSARLIDEEFDALL